MDKKGFLNWLRDEINYEVTYSSNLMSSKVVIIILP